MAEKRVELDVDGRKVVQAANEIASSCDKAADSLESLGGALSDVDSKAGKTSGLKAQAEAQRQVGAAAEESAKRQRTATERMQDAANKAVEQAATIREAYKKAYAPTAADRSLGASSPAYEQINKLRREMAGVSKDASVTEEEYGAAVARTAAKYELAIAVLERAGVAYADMARMSAETRSSLLATIQAMDEETAAAERMAQATALAGESQTNINKLLGVREFYALSSEVEADYAKFWQGIVDSQDRAAAMAATQSQTNVNTLLGIKEFYALSSEVEADYTKFWQSVVDSQDRAAAQAGAQSRDNINKLLGVREFYALSSEVESDYVSLWQRLADAQDKVVAASAAEAQRDINALLGVKEFKEASRQQEIEMQDHWERMLKQRDGGGGNGNFGPSAEYLGQSRLASLSPDYAKDQRLNALSQERVATEKALAAAIASGAVPAAKAGEVQKQLAEHYAKAEEKAAKMNGTIHLSNNAYLQLTASARNTFDSLAAGLPVSQIMITQGAQVVSALASEGSFMRALIGPTGAMVAGFLALAAAAATVVVHTVNLNSQLRDLRSTAMAYGNLSVSAEAAAESVRRIADNSQFSRAEAMEAVKELTKLRNLSGDVRVGVEGTAASFATATGAKLPDAVKKMTAAFDGTFAGIQKLDEEFNFLDAAQLKNIRTMVKAGEVTKANQMSLDAFTKQMRAAGEAAEGSAAKGFQAMSRAWNEALDAMSNSTAMKEIDAFLERLAKGISASANMTPAQRANADVDAAKRDLSEKQGASFFSKDIYNMLGVSDDVADARKRLAEAEKALADVLEKEARDRAARPDTAALQNKAYETALDKLGSDSAEQLRVARMTDPRAQARAEAEKSARAAGPQGMRTDALPGEAMSPFNAYVSRAGDAAAELAQVAIDKQTAALKRQVLAEKELASASLLGARAMSEARAAAAGREAAANGGNAAAARAASLSQDEYRALSTLKVELNKLDAAQTLLNRSREVGIEVATIEMRLGQSGLGGTSQEADARAKLTEIVRKEADEKARLNGIAQDSLRQQTALLSAQNDNISASERAYRQAEIAARAKYDEKPDDRALANDLALAELEHQRANATAGRDIRLQMNPAAARDQQIAELNVATGISPEDYAAKMEVIRRTHEDSTIARLDLENGFASGAERSMRRYVQSVGSVADQTERVMTNAFKGMEDALVEFAMTGKLNFADLANSIIRDMVRMQVQASITGPLSGALGVIGKSIVGAVVGGDSGTTAAQAQIDPSVYDAYSIPNAHGNAFANDNVIPFANGGTFTNNVVSNPTLFKFAQGAKMGVMGEAGPEAIVPLTRGPNGDLGVQAFGGGGGAPAAEAPRISVEINNYGSSKDFEVEQDFSGLVPIVRIIARDEANKRVESFAQNEMPKSLRGEYKINRPPVARG